MSDAVQGIASTAQSWPEEHLELLRRLLQNVLSAPQDAKYRRLKLANPKIAALLTSPGALAAFEALGWTSDGSALELPAAADLGPFGQLLQRTAPAAPTEQEGEPWVVTVLRGPLRTKLELPWPATLSSLAAAIERSEALGRMPRSRQRLLSGFPPKPLQAGASLATLGVKSVLLQDMWEDLVAELRSRKASFTQLADTLGRPALRALVFENRDFVLQSARAMLARRTAAISAEEVCAARLCFQALWPLASPGERLTACTECAVSTIDEEEDEDEEDEEERFVLEVERARLFESALGNVLAAEPMELQRPLEVRFRGEAAEDAGGLRREFFNEFGRAAARAEAFWRVTPAGALVPLASSEAARRTCETQRRSAYRGCGRVFGMALCQPQPRPMLLGLPLASSFLRCLQADPPESLDALQAELNAEQHSASPDFRGSSAFRERSLRELGLEGQLSFAVALPGGGSAELMPGGASVPVTDESKEAWLRAVLRFELLESVEEAAAAFRQGVVEVAGLAHLALLTAAELREEWSGRGDVTDEDLKTWRARTDVSPAVARQAEWLFELLAVGDLRPARGRVLKFATGSDRWPANAHSFRFVIEPMDGGDETLPCAMTCGNMLQLPRYSKPEPLRDRLLQAMDWGLDLHLA